MLQFWSISFWMTLKYHHYWKFVLARIFVHSRRNQADNALTAWCVMVARWRTLTGMYNSRRANLVSLPFASVMLSIHWNVSWIIWIINCNYSEYRLSNNIAHFTMRHLLCVVSYASSGSIDNCDQYPSASLILQAAPARRRSWLTWLTHWCRAYNIYSVLVVPVSNLTAVNSVVFQGLRLPSCSVIRSGKGEFIPSCGFNVRWDVLHSSQTL